MHALYNKNILQRLLPTYMMLVRYLVFVVYADSNTINLLNCAIEMVHKLLVFLLAAMSFIYASTNATYS